jgi:quercetin dioxygenase-like cupin family protein
MGMDPGETPRAQAHHVSDSMVVVDLATELQAVRATNAFESANHAAKTIAKQPGIRVVLIALKQGGQMHEHHTDWPITVQGIQGSVEFTLPEHVFVLTSGCLLTVAAGISHNLKGLNESAVLLTIGGAHSGS